MQSTLYRHCTSTIQDKDNNDVAMPQLQHNNFISYG